MLDKEKLDMAQRWLDKAGTYFNDVFLLLHINSFMSAATCAYYTMLYSAKAVLTIDGELPARHGEIVAAFRKRYERSDVFEKRYTELLENAYEVRRNVDEKDYFEVSKGEAIMQITNAETFYRKMKDYIAAAKNRH